VSEHPRIASGRPRKLRLRARAERQQETRRRIVSAAVALHEELGPLATTISAIAKRAGVERLTVYRHFPDEQSLFRSCTEHYFAAHPPPQPQKWLDIRDPEERLERGLAELYAYWSENRRMVAGVLRDYQVAGERIGSGTVDFIAAVTEALLKGWGLRGRRRARLRAAIAVAVHFRTWETLADQGLSDRDGAALMTALVHCAADRPR
jgi:AcrR family transcriptional regulator